jgi:transcription antitermination factor NusG
MLPTLSPGQARSLVLDRQRTNTRKNNLTCTCFRRHWLSVSECSTATVTSRGGCGAVRTCDSSRIVTSAHIVVNALPIRRMRMWDDNGRQPTPATDPMTEPPVVCPVDVDEYWYALQIRCGREHFVSQLLQAKTCRVFLPVYESRRTWSDRVKTFQLPLFPGYLFCRMSLSERSVPVITTPGVQRIVGFGSAAAPIPESEVNAVRSICASGLRHGPYPYSSARPNIRVMRGPLAGMEGTLLRLNGRDRLVVSVSLLQRSVAVHISADWVTMESATALA